MQFTQDEKAALLKQYEPLLRSTVRRACAYYSLNAQQVYHDLYQTAALIFLRHLSKVKDRYMVGGCKLDLNQYIAREVRRMFFVSIPREEFSAMHKKVFQLPLECALNVPDGTSVEEWDGNLHTQGFLDILKEAERLAVLMRAEQGCTNKEIMPVIGAKNEMGVSRFFQKMGGTYTKYSETGEGVAS